MAAAAWSRQMARRQRSRKWPSAANRNLILSAPEKRPPNVPAAFPVLSPFGSVWFWRVLSKAVNLGGQAFHCRVVEA